MSEEIQEVQEEKQDAQELKVDEGAKLLQGFIDGEIEEQEAKEQEAEKAQEPEGEAPEITPEIQAEMDDYQSLIDKGYDKLSDEEKARFDDYKDRYLTEEREEEEKKDEPKEPEAWKDYKEEDLLKKIEAADVDDITDDHIEFLRSLGHELNVEEPEAKEDTEGKDKKPEEDKLPDYVQDLLGTEYLKGREFKTTQEAEEGLREYIHTMEKLGSNITGVLTNTPEFAGVLSDLIAGKKPEETIKKHFEDLFNEEAPKPGDDGYEDYVAQKIEKRKALEAENEKKKITAQNMKQSVDNAVKFVKSKNLSQDQATEYFTKLDGLVENLSQKIVPEELMDLVYKGMNYDKLEKDKEKAVKDAEARGEIRGLNRKITIQKSTPKGDGLKRVIKRNAPREIKSEVTYASDDAKRLEDFLKGK